MPNMEERLDSKLREFAAHLADVFKLPPDVRAKLLKEEDKPANKQAETVTHE